MSKSMNQEIIEYLLAWRGINITIRYKPDYFKSTNEIIGFRLAHLEVIAKNKTPLPFTESGYRSHFTNPSEIEEYGTPVDFVKAWLEETAKSKQWKKHREQRNQLTLF